MQAQYKRLAWKNTFHSSLGLTLSVATVTMVNSSEGFWTFTNMTRVDMAGLCSSTVGGWTQIGLPLGPTAVMAAPLTSPPDFEMMQHSSDVANSHFGQDSEDSLSFLAR